MDDVKFCEWGRMFLSDHVVSNLNSHAVLILVSQDSVGILIIFDAIRQEDCGMRNILRVLLQVVNGA